MPPVRIGIIGDFKAQHHTHVAINTAIGHTAEALGIQIDHEWLPTPSVTEQALKPFDALWATPASPYESMDGMLRGIEYARTRMVPFTGT